MDINNKEFTICCSTDRGLCHRAVGRQDRLLEIVHETFPYKAQEEC